MGGNAPVPWLVIKGLTFTEAKYTGASGKGGCVYSDDTIFVVDSVISGCQVFPAGTQPLPARGGAIYSKEFLVLRNSIITGNAAMSSSSRALGGGVYAGALVASYYSTISGNVADSGVFGEGGGVYVKGASRFDSAGAAFIRSTISGNSASHFNGGMAIHNADDGSASFMLINSTVSGNRAGDIQGGGGIYMRPKVNNSTIAFNTAASSRFAVGLYFKPTVNSQSSIFSDNIADDGIPYDVQASTYSILGANNLIRFTSSLVPDDTLVDSPMLAPLADNGGPTRTHAIARDSPAIDAGNNNRCDFFDQRGIAFSRVFGPHADIGAFEYQGAARDLVFKNGFDPCG
jgi:hypothetical protein